MEYTSSSSSFIDDILSIPLLTSEVFNFAVADALDPKTCLIIS